ncbi:MAG: YafY family transcriptional regulator [Burkholderiaceae bacterium]|nr:YafY family transcriptional regulator [Burkholderiaceae bacterium]
MDRTERFYKIDSLLQAHRVVPVDQMLAELEVSLATFKRDIEYMRNRLNAPIEWDRDAGGYRYATGAALQQNLPGLWFNASEAYALLMMQALMAEIQPGLLGAHLEPLRARLRAVIEAGQHPAADVESKVKLLTVAARPVPDKYFELVASALLRRIRLDITYFARGRNESSQREISPQMLVHHRGNWYLAAWCHKQNAMRSFAMDSIERVEVLGKAAKSVPKSELTTFIGQGYGIFSGNRLSWATLRFSAERTRWVTRELWHPQQRTKHDAEGRLILELPYTDARELIMDILRHGHHVEVLKPETLRDSVKSELALMVDQYQSRAIGPGLRQVSA